MNYIDKTIRKPQADGVVNNYIVSQRLNGYDCSYYNFTRTPFKNQLRDILIDEQKYLCCYCMRSLYKNETTTLEHVIPKGTETTIANLNQYKVKYPLYFTEVIHRDLFTLISIYPPYPHQIAYQNIVASCNGVLHENSKSGFCCNQKRGNTEIVPLMFDANISNKVTYTRSGIINSLNTDINTTIWILNLNNETLKEIRILWAKIKYKNITIIRLKFSFLILSS
jgi:hypothetical protein